MPGNEVSLYFHIPFCKKKCDYCHFFVLPDHERFKTQFREAVSLEWQLRKETLASHRITSIYFGGGTPYLLGPEAIGEMVDAIKNTATLAADCEITLEANPEAMRLEEVEQYAEAGVNRLSIGVQSLDDNLLRVLSREHSSAKATLAPLLAQQAGIANVSIDLMYDIPTQTLKQWKETLAVAAELPITHISLYNLVIEPRTVFFKKKEALKVLMPEGEASADMFQMAVERLTAAGFHHYEISAFSKPGFASRHNSGYWTGRPFLGFGPSAFSYWEGKRFSNVSHLNRYHDLLKKGVFPVDFEEKLEDQERLRELLAIHLRLLDGVDLASFERAAGDALDAETSGRIHALVSQGLLERTPDILKLTKKGILFYDSMASGLI